MPFTYEIDPERELAVITATGSMTGESLVEMVRALADDERWSPSYRRLVDGTNLEEFVFEVEHMQQFAKEIKGERKRARKTAVVVTSDMRAVGVNAVRLHLMDDYPVRAFYTVGEARAWLDEE